MMKEFDVRLVDYNIIMNAEAVDIARHYLGRIYISPESEHIFEPKGGDLLEIWYQDEMSKLDKIYNKNQANKIIARKKSGRIEDLKIIMHNNKHFFYPEIENKVDS